MKEVQLITLSWKSIQSRNESITKAPWPRLDSYAWISKDKVSNTPVPINNIFNKLMN